MKNKHLIAFILALLTLNFNVTSGSTWDADNSNYVVIGAFSLQGNATHLVENAKKLNFKAEFAINPTRKLYYVYVLHTGNISEAMEQARKIRSETPFNDTWVYKGLLGADAQTGTDVNPVTEQKLPQVEVIDHSQEKSAVADQKITDSGTTQPTSETNAATSLPVAIAEVKNETPAKTEEIEEGGKGFIFKLISASGNELKGEVDMIDAERLTKAASYESSTRMYIKPVNKTGKITLIGNVFGYRKVQREINYNMPDSTSGVIVEGGNTIIPFELIKLRKGDIAVMYNVLFFKDAAIMRPDSRYEVTSLLDMMKENPKYKIKIHGHANGNAAGKIIRMGDNNNFFSLTGSKDGFGSAKELSESRAEVIRDFLISEGIDPKRLLVKAWGGKKPIHDKKSNKAHENVRVEVEILED